MESELTRHLLLLVASYAEARAIEESTVGRLCAADGRFFARLRGGKAYTVRKYDRVLQWFSANWPAGVAWPDGVVRPSSGEATA